MILDFITDSDFKAGQLASYDAGTGKLVPYMTNNNPCQIMVEEDMNKGDTALYDTRTGRLKKKNLQECDATMLNSDKGQETK